MSTMKSAIIDIGSNTIRLVIYAYSPITGLKEVENIKAVARLRNFLQQDQTLSEEGILIFENILVSFLDILADYEVYDVRAVATASIRQAKNGQQIIQQMKEKYGITIRLLSEKEEAFYGYYAVVHTTSTKSGVTIDMGGGSTEITFFFDKEIQNSISLPFGSVSLKKQFVAGDTMTEKERQQVYQFAYEMFEKIAWLNNLKLPVIGIGGSARNMAKMDQVAKNYPLSGVHQYRMSKQDFLNINEQLAGLTLEQLKHLDGLSSDRADIIGPVSEVFRALMMIVGAQKFQFSRKGLREGLVIYQLVEEGSANFHKENVYGSTAKFLAAEFGKTEQQVAHHIYLAELLYTELCKTDLWTYYAESVEYLRQAAPVYFVGEYLEADAASQHSFYLLSNRSIDGLNHKERVRVALLASYKNREQFKKYLQPFITWFSKDEIRYLQSLGMLLKIAYALDASKRNIVENITIQLKKDGAIQLNIVTQGNALAEEYQMSRQKKHLEKDLKKVVHIQFQEKD